MRRKFIILIFAAAVLASCGPSSGPYGGFPQALYSRTMRDQAPQVFSYSHFLMLAMSHESIDPRFERARDKCLHDAALSCTLISASVSATDGTYYKNSEATLAVAMPHEKIAVFEKSLLEPVPQDGAVAVTVQSRSTRAENVTNEASDLDHKIAQLTNYRDSLAALAKRGDLAVSDIMKIDAELSKVQGDLDMALAQKRDVGERIAKEQLTVSFGEQPDALAPIARAWSNARISFIDSTADAINFLIRALPWLPIVAGGVWLISLFWRWFRRKKPAATA